MNEYIYISLGTVTWVIVSCVGNPDMIWYDIYQTQDTGSAEGSHGDV